jgi:hypothetical protein
MVDREILDMMAVAKGDGEDNASEGAAAAMM